MAYIVTFKFFPSVNKFGMVYTLIFRCFCICYNLALFHTKLTSLKEVFPKNGYLEKFFEKGFGSF